MTDGILLAEIQHDRWLSEYDTLIIDEAHERSLNIDFLLGYLSQLLAGRPDLKLIITSATIDPSASPGLQRCPGVRSRAAPIRSTCATVRPPILARERDEALHPAVLEAVDELSGWIRAISSCSCPASATSASPPSACASMPAPDRAVAALRPAGAEEQPGVPVPTPAGASCSPPTSPRPR